VICSGIVLEGPADVLTVTVAVSPGLTCQMWPGPLGIGTGNVIAVSLQLPMWKVAPSNGAPQLVPPSTEGK